MMGFLKLLILDFLKTKVLVLHIAEHHFLWLQKFRNIKLMVIKNLKKK
jgi:hypothetical protein